MSDSPPLDNWKYRRRVVFGALIFAALGIDFVIVALVMLSDMAVVAALSSIATSLIAAAVSIIGLYVFGAILDDHNIRKQQS